MFKNTKLTLIILGILILGLLFLWSAQNGINDNNNQSVSGGHDYTRTGLIEFITQTDGEGYRRFSLTDEGHKNLIITFYQNERGSTVAERDRRGVLVFQNQPSGEVKLLWESNDKITAAIPILGTLDLTGDGVKEILALWQTGYSEGLYIYKYNGVGFDMITPYLDSKSPYGKGSHYLGFGGEDSLTKIVDVDKDGVPEITFPFLLNQGGGITYHAYKWDGSKYFLWKEQETPFTSDGRDEFSVVYVIDRIE
ncbi:MAG: hypothetical protein WAX44_03275 [Minisyncoccia bacterium]